MYRLGMLYLEGRSVPYDYGFGRRLLRLAAESGHRAAQAQLDQMERRGVK
jgi:TPR repeat protein